MDGENNNQQPNFEVPAQPGKIESVPSAVPEQLPGRETPGSSAPAQQPTITTDPATIAQPAQDVPIGAPSAQPSTSPPAKDLPDKAADVDLIEKQWVTKAKHIVEKTKNDPYVQNKELSKVKAEYVSKRFNKELKTSEDSAV